MQNDKEYYFFNNLSTLKSVMEMRPFITFVKIGLICKSKNLMIKEAVKTEIPPKRKVLGNTEISTILKSQNIIKFKTIHLNSCMPQPTVLFDIIQCNWTCKRDHPVKRGG